MVYERFRVYSYLKTIAGLTRALFQDCDTTASTAINTDRVKLKINGAKVIGVCAANKLT